MYITSEAKKQTLTDNKILSIMKYSNKIKKMVADKIDSKKSYEELRKISWQIWHELADDQPVNQSNILDLLIKENKKKD